jgi:fibronectin-binding autotransporter adhesin
MTAFQVRRGAALSASVRARRLARCGLLGSTALVAASLAATGAMAQTVVDNTGTGGGVRVTNAPQGVPVVINGVTVNNTTGSPTIEAYRVEGSTTGLNSTGVTLNGVNTLTTTVSGGSALYVTSNANIGITPNASGSAFTGSYGINVSAPGGYLAFQGAGQSLSFVANGSHITGFNAVTNINAGLELGASTFTGFNTGINASNFYGTFVEMTGGSIDALITGIRTDATGGGSTILSQAAIVAPTGIHSSNTNGTTITTSGAGTIDSTATGVGVGIIATSSGGANAIQINVGAAIGGATAHGAGVQASTTGASTGAINITTTAEIVATGRGISATSVGYNNAGAITVGADVTGATGVYANNGNNTVTIGADATVTSTGSGASNAALYLVNGSMAVTNSGALVASGAGSNGVLLNSSAGMMTNTAGGTITGSTGVHYPNRANLTNAGTITGTGVAALDAGVRTLGGTFNNTGSITGNTGMLSQGNPFVVNNTGGSITGVLNAINVSGGVLTLTNTGTIQTVGGTAGAGLAGVYLNSALTATQQITNSGTISGGSDAAGGFGVNVDDGILVLTNQAGGTISGGTGGIRLASDDLATLNLNDGSTVTGGIISTGAGGRTVNLSGALTGGYTGGVGIDTITLAATGSMTSADLGAGNDIVNWQGGIFSGVIDGGTGTDTFNSNLGTGSASLSLNNLTGFETYAHQAGDLTLTGSRTGGAGWTLVPGTSLTLDGSLSVTGTAIQMNGNGAAATVSLLAGSTLNGNTGVYYNTGFSHNFDNAGAITATSMGVFSNGPLTATNTGTIAATTGAAFSFGFSSSTVNNAGALTGGSDADTGFGVWSYNGATVNNTGTITGGSGGISSGRVIGASTYGGLLTVTNGATGDITGDVGILTGGSSRLTLHNAGLIEGTASSGVVANGTGLVSITNTDSGEILGVASGIAANGGAATIINDGTITASGTTVGTAGIVTGAGGSITNKATGVISGGFQGVLNNAGALTITNAGTITGGAPSDAIFSDGELTLVNTGTIEAHASGYSGVVFVGSGGSVVNAGLLRGGSNLDYGYGVQVGGATTAVSITNQSGGLIDGGVGAIRIHSNADVAIDLQAGSTTMGQIYSIGDGTITTTVAGVLNGAYNAAGGTGVDNLTLAATGSMTGASLGAGDDSFTWQGGTFSGLINGGTGTDSFISNLGAVAGSVDLASFSGFESIIHQSGALTLTGASASGAAEIHAGQGGPAGTLIFGAVTGLTGDIFVNGATIRAETAGAFGTGAIHLINPTVSFGASGTYANDILLEVASPATADPATLQTDVGVTATLTGAITQGAGAGVDPVQPLVIGGWGRIVLTGTANLWAGVTTINAGATLQGATDTISGSSVVADGALHLVQPASGAFAQDVSGGGSVQISGLGADQVLTLSGDLTNALGVRVLDASALSLTGSVTTTGSFSAVTLNTGNHAGVTSHMDNSGAVSGVFAIHAVGGLDLTNSGSIAAAITNFNSSGIYAGGAGVIDNSGSITSGTNAIFTQGVGSISNSGLIRGGGSASVVRLLGAGSSVTNLAGGQIASAGSGTGVYLDGADASVVNAGGISGGNAGATLLADGEVTNTATGQITGGNHGLVVYGTAHVTNMAAGVLRGDVYNAVYAGGDGTTVTNAGLMEGGNAALYLNGDDTVINNSGVIRVTGTTAPTVISGVYVSGSGAAIANSGAIESGLTDGRGILLTGGGGSIDNLSGGVISGNGDGAAILLTGADYVLNLREGSTVNGLIDASATTGLNLVSIAGDLNGAYVGGSGADQLSLLGGGAFGVLMGGDGVDSLRLTGADNGALDIGLVAGFETRVLDGSGVWTLTGADAETVGWVLDAGTLRLTGGQAANDLGAIQVNAGGVLSVGDSEGIGALTGAGSVTIDDGEMLFVGLDHSDSLFSGIVSGQGGLAQSGAGTLTLAGANTYTGWTSVEAGVLQLGAAGVLADASSLSVGEAGVLDLQAFDETVALAVIRGALSGSGVLTAARYELDGATIDADLGAGDLYALGGVTTLNGSAASDLVVVQDGVLRLGAADRLSDLATLIIGQDGSLDLQAFDEAVDAAAISGRLAGSGTLSATQYELDGATIDANLGAGTLLNLGGVSTLNGASAAGLVRIEDGALVLGAADRLSDAATVAVASGATLDLGAFDEAVTILSLAGALDGTGTLTAAQYQLEGGTVNAGLGEGALLQLSGVSVLNGASLTQTVAIEGGVLQLGAADRLSDTATVAVASGATLDLGAFDEVVSILSLSGALDGAGTLTAAQYQLAGGTVNADLGDGVLFQLSGVSTLNGASSAEAVAIQGGTLALGGADRLSDTATVQIDAGASLALQDEIERIGALFGSGRVDVGAGRLVFGGQDSAFDGVLTGMGEVEHTAGVFTLMGSHDIASILNSGGELRYLAETSGSVSVTGGTLTGAGTIGGALTLESGGVLSPGVAGLQNGIGSFVVGSLVMNGGTLALDVLGVSQGELIDGILVTGVADVRGGIVDPTFQGEASDFNFATRYVFLQAGDLVGRFANGGAFTASDQEGIYWRVRYDLLADAAVMELRQLVDFDPGPTGSGNGRSVAAMLSKGQLEASDDFSAVLELMADLDADDRTAAFDSMSGEGLVSIGAAFNTADDAFLRTVWASGGSAPGSVQMSGGGAGRLGQSLAALETGVGSPASGGWATFYTSERTLDGARAGQASVQTRLEGAAGGYSLALGPVTLGAAGGVSNLEGEVDQRGARYDSNVTHVGAFARYATGGWTFDLTGTHFSGDVDTNRWIEIGDYAGQASGLTQAEGGSVALRLSHRFDLSADTRVILGAAAAVGRSEVDAFTEQGAGGLSLEAAAQDREWRTVQLGVRGEHGVDLGAARVNLYAGLAGLGQVGETAAIGDMRLTGAADGFGDFRVEGAATPSSAAQLEFGAETTVEQGVTFSIGYRGLVSDRLQDHAVGAGLRLRW